MEEFDEKVIVVMEGVLAEPDDKRHDANNIK